jgi:hypothetical protein
LHVSLKFSAGGGLDRDVLLDGYLLYHVAQKLPGDSGQQIVLSGKLITFDL